MHRRSTGGGRWPSSNIWRARKRRRRRWRRITWDCRWSNGGAVHLCPLILFCVQMNTGGRMSSSTFTVRVDSAVKKRLEKLAKSTGRSRSFLAAEAIEEYVDVNEWQVAGIKQAVASADRGETIPHDQ